MHISLPNVPPGLLSDIHCGFDALIARRSMPMDAEAVKTRQACNSAILAIPSELKSVRVGVARLPEQVAAAAALVCERYSWRGYELGSPAQNCDASPADEAIRETMFIAENKQTTLGTLTLGLDGPLGLRADLTYGEVVDAMRRKGRLACEVTRLAVTTGPVSRSVLASLFSLAYTASHLVHGATDMFIEVNPRHVSFYARLLGFVVAAAERFCERVRAPSVLLHLELAALEERLRKLALQPTPEPVFVKAA